MKNKIFMFDVETTGLDPKVNAIHQLSGAIIVDGKIEHRFNYHIKPFQGAVVEQVALDVSGVTAQQIQSYDDPRVVYQDLIAVISRFVDRYDKKDKMFLAGYNNASFDNQFLRSMFERNGDKYFGSYFWSSPLDVFILASFKLMKMRHIMPDFKLKTVAEAFGITIEENKLHSADYDIDLTIQIMNSIGNFD